MTDSDLFELDAQYWFGDHTHHKLLAKWVPRLLYYETEYGNNIDADGRWIDFVPFSIDLHVTRCFFSLLLAEILRDE